MRVHCQYFTFNTSVAAKFTLCSVDDNHFLCRFSAAPSPEAKREVVEQRTLSVDECRLGEGSLSLLPSLAQPLLPQPAYRADLSKVTIGPERVAKVVPDRIFSLALHPGCEKIVVAAGDKWGKVGLEFGGWTNW